MTRDHLEEHLLDKVRKIKGLGQAKYLVAELDFILSQRFEVTLGRQAQYVFEFYAGQDIPQAILCMFKIHQILDMTVEAWFNDMHIFMERAKK